MEAFTVQSNIIVISPSAYRTITYSRCHSLVERWPRSREKQRVGWCLHAAVDPLDDLPLLLLQDALVNVAVHLLVHEVPKLGQVVI